MKKLTILFITLFVLINTNLFAESFLPNSEILISGKLFFFNNFILRNLYREFSVWNYALWFYYLTNIALPFLLPKNKGPMLILLAYYVLYVVSIYICYRFHEGTSLIEGEYLTIMYVISSLSLILLFFYLQKENNKDYLRICLCLFMIVSTFLVVDEISFNVDYYYIFETNLSRLWILYPPLLLGIILVIKNLFSKKARFTIVRD